ncbi:hypothetical protein MBLNU457_g2585t1 [Dothideomycetes sp. NU457]
MSSLTPRGQRGPRPNDRGSNFQAWLSWAEVRIRVFNLPPNLSVEDIHKFFSKYGDIDFIDIENRAFGKVLITFSPPPYSQFWAQPIIMHRKDNGHVQAARAELANLDQNTYAPSPLNKLVLFPAKMALYAESLRFGMMTGPNSVSIMRRLVATQEIPLMFTLELNNARNIEIRFVVPRGERTWQYKLQIRFSHLAELRQFPGRDDTIVLAFSLRYPPKYLAMIDDTSKFTDPYATKWNVKQAFHRETDIDRNTITGERPPLSVFRSDPFIDTGRWLTYALTFRPIDHNKALLPKICNALEAHNVRVLHEPLVLNEGVSSRVRPLWQTLNNPGRGQVQTSSLDTLAAVSPAEAFHSLSYEVRYQLEVCLSENIFNEHNLVGEFFLKLAEIDNADGLLANVAASRRTFYNPMEIFDLTEYRARRKHRLPKECVLMHSVTITPTTMYVKPLAVEITNRVIRKYIEHADRFLRVRFQDEDYFGSLQAQRDDHFNRVYLRVKQALYKGITVGGRHFEFLHFGNSQFRENGAYFFSPPSKNLTPLHIRGWMGYFSHIREIAKYASRIGQCFSTTKAVSSIGQNPAVVEIPDIQRNGFCFTDGVGKMSPFVADLVSNELKLANTPSLFQFRMAGCKGVLVVDPSVTGKTIHTRPSQNKFKADYSNLEIIRVSSFATAFLNRQIILVLSAVGVPDDVFLTKIRKMLEEINAAMEDNKRALELLEHSIDMNQVTLSIAKMLNNGFRNDPFVASLLQLWRAWAIKGLKEKANIVVKDGAFLLGCVDETGALEMDGDLPEIFLQIPDTTSDVKGAYRVATGRCILVRNPALHPGDIRVVNAVDKPVLRHLKDVVVFPQTGARPLANMCSGGDLDGDDYLVMWDKDLLPKIVNPVPMDYTPPAPKIAHGPVTSSDVIHFFCDYMKNDALGTIAVAHRAWADHSPLGVMDEKCLQLAQLHSEAVDYPKTGVPAVLTDDLRIKKYPHWCEKPEHMTYESKKIVGKLYDEVQRVEFKPDYQQSFDPRILNAFPELPDELLATAKALKTDYDTDMRRVMAQFGVQTEFEIWSAFVMQHNREINSYKFGEELGRIMATLKGHHREATQNSTENKELRSIEFYQFVAAAYVVTANDVITSNANGNNLMILPNGEISLRQKPLMSFPWIFTDELIHLALAKDALPDGQPLEMNHILQAVGNSRQPRSWKLSTSTRTSTPAPVLQPLPEVDLPARSSEEPDVEAAMKKLNLDTVAGAGEIQMTGGVPLHVLVSEAGSALSTNHNSESSGPPSPSSSISSTLRAVGNDHRSNSSDVRCPSSVDEGDSEESDCEDIEETSGKLQASSINKLAAIVGL